MNTKEPLQVTIQIGAALTQPLCQDLRQQVLEAMRALSPTSMSVDEFNLTGEQITPDADSFAPDFWILEVSWADYQGEVTGIKSRLSQMLDPVVQDHRGVAVDMRWQIGDLVGRDHLALSTNREERGRQEAFLCGEHLMPLLDHFGLDNTQAGLLAHLVRCLIETQAGLRAPITAIFGLVPDGEQEILSVFKVAADAGESERVMDALLDLQMTVADAPESPVARALEKLVQARRLPVGWQAFQPVGFASPVHILENLVDLFTAPALPGDALHALWSVSREPDNELTRVLH